VYQPTIRRSTLRATIVQYADDRMRSRVLWMRLAVSFGVSSLAVYLLGPTVKAAGFTTLLVAMALISASTTLFVPFLPGRLPAAAAARAPCPPADRARFTTYPPAAWWSRAQAGRDRERALC